MIEAAIFGTVVISVGETIESINFRRSNGQYPCDPKVASLTLVEGEKLRILNIKWANGLTVTRYITSVVQHIQSFLEQNTKFVFYRHGSYLGVDTDFERATNVVSHEIGFSHYVLVVGSPHGLAKQLEMDVKIVANMASLDDEALKKLCSSLSQNNNYGQFYTEVAVFTLLVVPTAEDLKKKLSEFILLCCGTSLTIIYSGHGDKDRGSWVLNGDDRFSGSDLQIVLKGVEPQHYPKIYILLNCCYGFAFAEDIGVSKFLTGCLKYMLSSKKIELELRKCLSIQNGNDDDVMSKAIKVAANEPDDNLYGEWFDLNQLLTAQIYNIVKGNGYRGFESEVLNYAASIVPFSAGPLDAVGILPNLCQEISEKYKEILPFCSFVPTRSLSVRDAEPVAQCLSDDPHLIVFPASNGDSTLFHWNGFNMLVDGGLCKDPPCFWETVRHLPDEQCLDVVVVTHYDNDHILGILGLFEDVSNPINIGALYTMHPLHVDRKYTTGKTLYDLANTRSDLVLNDLIANPIKPIVSNNGLRIFMLTPSVNDESRIKAAKEMRQLTAPNKASASLLIECMKDEHGTIRYIYALLTGDAPGNKIITGLGDVIAADKTVEENLIQDGHYNFKYIDMPHHGSNHNDPSEFLHKIKTEVCVVSTNGRYKHPGDKTLEQLEKAFDEQRIQQLLFTYQDFKENRHSVITDKLSPGRNYRFAQNNHRSNGTKCWRFNLAQATLQNNPLECECRTVLNQIPH